MQTIESVVASRPTLSSFRPPRRLTRRAAFALATAKKPWKQWNRADHIAYALIRGVPFSKIERVSNDKPPYLAVTELLAEWGAWSSAAIPAVKNSWWRRLFGWVETETHARAELIHDIVCQHLKDVLRLAPWERKTPRKKTSAEPTKVSSTAV